MKSAGDPIQDKFKWHSRNTLLLLEEAQVKIVRIFVSATPLNGTLLYGGRYIRMQMVSGTIISLSTVPSDVLNCVKSELLVVPQRRIVVRIAKVTSSFALFVLSYDRTTGVLITIDFYFS